MPYIIERYKYGVVKRFSGEVTFQDVLRSEQQVHCDPDFTRMRYVVSDYTEAEYHGLTEEQMLDVNALRIGGHYSNPRLKYAFVNLKPEIRAQIASAVRNGEMLHQAEMFDSLEHASDWAML
jgi:hypothetical protein